MEFEIVSPQKVVMKDDNWCQTLGQFTSVHFSDLNSDSYDINNMVFELNISTKVNFITNYQDR